MINESNYFLSSEGKFKALTKGTIKPFVAAWLAGEMLLVDHKGVEWHLNHVSERYGGWYHSLSLSVYWTDGERLLRISNHWCGGASEQYSVKFGSVALCNSIAKCYWTISGRTSKRNVLGILFEGHKTLLEGGMIRFADLKEIR